MASFELQPGENLLKKGRITVFQGSAKIKFLIDGPFQLTNQRLVYYNVGNWAGLYTTLGWFLKLLLRGKRVDVPLLGSTVSRGQYGLNKDLVALRTADGQEILIYGFKTWIKNLSELLNGQNGVQMIATGTETWAIQKA